jgi:proteasome lid subunit RPN8/RPN11
MVAYPEGVLEAATAHAQAAYPEEACGLVLRACGNVSYRPVENALDRYHAADPGQFPRTNRDGFLLDPRTSIEILSARDLGELEVLAVVHSHVDAGAHFSAADLEGALGPGGVPLLPGVEHLVIEVRGPAPARAGEVRAYRLEEGRAAGRQLRPPPLPNGPETC